MNSINLIFPYDYIIIGIIVIIILFSFWKGFLQSVLGLMTWVGSVLITIYAYNTVAELITKQALKISFFQNLEYITSITSIIISIPSIFVLSLFVLRRIKKFLSSDLEKNVFGIFLDKVFGIIYGILFSYAILTAIIIMLERYEFNQLDNWISNNSYVMERISYFNNDYIYLLNEIKKEEIY